MTFRYFKSKINSMLENSDTLDDQAVNDLYTEFRKYWKKYTVAEFIQFWFKDWTLERHGIRLKK